MNVLDTVFFSKMFAFRSLKLFLLELDTNRLRGSTPVQSALCTFKAPSILAVSFNCRGAFAESVLAKICNQAPFLWDRVKRQAIGLKQAQATLWARIKSREHKIESVFQENIEV